MIRYTKILTFIISLNLFSSCTDECESQETSIINISFFDKNTGISLNPNFTRVYGLGSIQDLEVSGNTASFPLSLQNDSSVYIFEKETQKDTLTVQYERNFYFQSNKCGFVVEIKDLQLNSSQTSFEILSINNESYEISIAY